MKAIISFSTDWSSETKQEREIFTLQDLIALHDDFSHSLIIWFAADDTMMVEVYDGYRE